MSGAWKERERLVAKWFSSCRNPLSGRNNVDDAGNKRLGDVIHPVAVIEVKRRKANSTLFRAKETRDLANQHKKPWVHVEFATGQPGLVGFVMDFESAEKVAHYLQILWGPATPCSIQSAPVYAVHPPSQKEHSDNP